MYDRLLMMLALMLVCAAAHAGGNLLHNGGFEEPLAADGSIPGWTANKALQQQSLTLDDHAYTGDKAVCILSTVPTDGNSVLSQDVAIEPGADYQLNLAATRDSFVYGTLFRVSLLKDGEAAGRQDISFRSNNTWRPLTLAFNAGEANTARVELQTPNTGTWRITVGRRLWVDDVTLVKIDHERNITIPGDGATAAADVDVTEPGTYHLWARVNCAEPTRFTLTVGDDEPRVFRAYTTGTEYWLRPVIPELVIAEGRQRIAVQAFDDGARIEEVVMTIDPFWQPEGYQPFMTPEEALAAQRERGFDPIERGSVQLTLTGADDLPAGRRGVSQGLPFPRGTVAEPVNLRAADGRPVQADVLNRWADGSVKWALVSTFAEPGETITLEYGSAIPAPADNPAFSVERERGGVSVDTGALRFSVPAQGPALIEGLTDGERAVESIVGVVNDSFLTSGEREVEVEQVGPVRTAIRIAGPHVNEAGEKLMDYVVRVFAYAGESHLRVEHSFVQHDDIISVDLDSLVLRMETPVQSAVLEGTEVATAAGEATLTASLASEGSSVCDRPWTVAQNGATISEGVVADGRLIARGPGQMVVDIYDFARNAPKTFTVTPDRVDIGIVGGPFSFYKGMMKTHEMVIAFGDDGETVADAFEAQPLLLADANWYADSRATGHWPLGSYEERYPGYAAGVETTIRDWDNRQRQGDSTVKYGGMLQCGDPVGYEGGNNLESALEEGSMIQFLMTGRGDYFRYADTSIRHYSDIDIDHSDSTGGLIYVHGPHSRDKLDYGRAGINGHSWYNGVILYGLFMGSQRVLDTAPQVGEYYARFPFPPRELIHYWRQPAWKFMDLNQAYEVTADVAHLQAAVGDAELTRMQQDHVVHLWPYMFAVGAKAVRQYHDITLDPGARELYLQLMDGFMRLRERPDDTVNGEWPKAPGQLLGNFPNDRSCAYYNEAAHATWLSGDERFARAAGSDLAFQIAFNVNDPTLLWGSADLLRAMDQLGIPEPDLSAKLPETFMTPSRIGANADRPKIALQVIEDADRAFAIDLFKTSYRKYNHAYEGTAIVYAPDGTEVTSAPVRMDGLQRYRLEVPADGQTGVYAVTITVDDPWYWSVDALDFDLEAGEHTIRLCTRYDRQYIDAICIARAGEYFPTLHGDPPAGSLILQVEDGEMEPGMEVVEWVDALGGGAVRATTAEDGDNGPWVTLNFEVPEAGRYRFFARTWKSYADLINVQIDDQEPFQCKQTHDMDGNPYPSWSIATTLGEDAIVQPYLDLGKYNMGAYNPTALLPHPALD